MKPGIKTTEFWASALAQVGLFITSLSGNLPPKWAGVFIVASNVAYALSRGLAKFKSFSVADIEATIKAFLAAQQPAAPK